ncbi:MAG: nucleotidyltransferase [Vicinamibacteria bacterium]
MTPDFVAMLSALSAEHVEFMLVGAHALAAHGFVRATQDIDVLVRPTPDNARRVFAALRAFKAPLFDLAEADLLNPDVIYQVGVEPNRIDLMNDISGVSWDEAWAGRTEIVIEGIRVPVLGIEEFVRNKRASGRPKDRADLVLIGRE